MIDGTAGGFRLVPRRELQARSRENRWRTMLKPAEAIQIRELFLSHRGYKTTMRFSIDALLHEL